MANKEGFVKRSALEISQDVLSTALVGAGIGGIWGGLPGALAGLVAGTAIGGIGLERTAAGASEVLKRSLSIKRST